MHQATKACTQIITVGVAALDVVTVPSNYDGLEENMLACDQKDRQSKEYHSTFNQRT
ncbi:MAG: hypothetical protein IPL98_19545 [Saprospiraceae bacterium]|nr:hypothetical protein [Saprospiraceae bacterium]